MILKKINNITLTKYSVGFFLACAYIFTSYVAQDILISSRLNSLFIYAFLLSSAYIFITNFRIDVKREGFFFWYLSFTAVSALLMLRSPSISGVFSSFYSMIVSLFIALCIQLHIKSEQGFLGICKCYSISSFLFIILLFLTGNLKGSADDRLGQEVLGNANIFAKMMMVGAMLTMWLLVYHSSGKLQKLGFLAITVSEMYALALSGGRKFFIVPLLFLYVLLWFRKDKRGRRHIFLYTILFAAIITCVVLLITKVPLLYNAIGVRMEGLFESFSGGEGDSSAEIRKTIRNLAFEKWKENPIIGYGFDSFKYLARIAVGHFYYSHCNYTELLYSGGVFYLILYYWFFWRIIRKCWQNKENPSSFKAFSIGITLCFLVFDYGAVTYNSTPTMVLLMMANCATFFKVPSQNSSQGETLA